MFTNEPYCNVLPKYVQHDSIIMITQYKVIILVTITSKHICETKRTDHIIHFNFKGPNIFQGLLPKYCHLTVLAMTNEKTITETLTLSHCSFKYNAD